MRLASLGSRLALYGLGAALALLMLVQPARSARALPTDPVRLMPEFNHRAPQDWINSPPLRWSDLEGRVVLVDFWAFDCWNCYRSIPWLHALEKHYAGKDFRIVGVHTPELSQERVRANLLAKVREYGLTNPIMIDSDYAYWNALDNRYWPAFYLVDRHGLLRGVFIGETHAGDANAHAVEQAIDALLAEEK